MIDFKNILYLKKGNSRQVRLYNVIRDHKLLEDISDYDHVITGTIPISIDIDTSDVDISCYWKDRSMFIKDVKKYSNYEKYSIVEKTIKNNLTIICRFSINEFDFEIFGQNRPIKEHEAYRHMIIEHKILQREGEEFRKEIIRLKESGIKTEPAFGKLLGLKNDPFLELLEYDI